MLVLLLLVGSTLALDCSTLNSCETCAGQSQGFLTCNWCLASKSCLDPATATCEHTDRIEVAFDCPRDPKPGFEYNETFGRIRALPLSAAAFQDDIQHCMDTTNTGVNVTKRVEIVCDVFNDTCLAYLGYSEAEKAVVLVARGSTGNQVLDEILETFDNNKAYIGGGYIQEYFYNAFDILWNGGVFDELTRLRLQFPDYELWVTGHSLGAAVASIFADMTVVKGLWPGEKIKLITLGQPRTGDLVYAQNHDARLPYSYRVIHAHDIVPHIPPKMGKDVLFHHRFEIWYNNDMKLGDPFMLCNRPDDDSCSNTVIDVIPSDHDVYYNYGLGECCRTGCTPR